MFVIDSISPIRNYFSGIAYSKDSIILSLDGMIEYVKSEKNLLELHSGRYSLVYSDNNSSLVMADPTGQDILYLYQSDGYWMISNSFYKLVEELRSKNLETEIYLPALCSYKIKHSLGGQPLSNNTIIRNVKILSRDQYISIKGNKLSIHQRIYNLSKITTNEEYKTELVKVISDQISVLGSLVNLLPEGSIRCDLSGGMDSRVAFGICSKIENFASKIKISSNPRLEDDYYIAQKLAQYYSVKLDNSAIGNYPRTISESEQFKLYKYGNSGIYNSIYKPNYSFTPRTLHIHGAGGESLRGQYQGSPRQIIGRLKSHFSSDEEYELVQQEFLNYFLEKGLDINDPRSMIDHSRNFRGRFHFGRNWFRFLTNPLYTPLSDIRLETLSDYLNKKQGDSISIFYDIYMILDDLLAFFPFDEQEKNIDIDKFKNTNIGLVKSHNNKINNNHLIYGQFIENEICEIPSQDVLADLSFQEAVNIEKEQFIVNYPLLKAEYSHLPHVFSILNILV